jgi:hypothetical protein
MQQATYEESSIETRSWTTRATGGAPMITIVKSIVEAAKIVEEKKQKVVAVVAPVRPR